MITVQASIEIPDAQLVQLAVSGHKQLVVQHTTLTVVS